MPVVEKSKQNTPHFTSEVIAGILDSSKGYKQMFCALLAGSGLRVGEASGLEIGKHVSEDFKTLYIRQKVRRGKLEHFLKTDAGCRDVDLCAALAGMLKTIVGTRTSGFLFRNRKGNSLSNEPVATRAAPRLERAGATKSGLSCLPPLPGDLASQEPNPRRSHSFLARPCGRDGDGRVLKAERRRSV